MNGAVGDYAAVASRVAVIIIYFYIIYFIFNLYLFYHIIMGAGIYSLSGSVDDTAWSDEVVKLMKPRFGFDEDLNCD